MDMNPGLGAASFCMFLVEDDFRSKLRIPAEFANKYGEILHRKMKLRSDYVSGEVWSVGVEKVGQRRFFKEGWNKFAEDVDLKHREYLMFKFVGGSTFDVSVYEITGCNKEPYTGVETEVPGKSVVKVKIEDTEQTWRFTKELKKHHYMTNRMEIPRDFAIGTGIATNRNITLVDAEGRKWPLKVTDRNIGVYGLTAGFKDFLKGNNVAIGSVISFEFIPNSDNIIEALVIKNGTANEHPIPAKRGRGRPTLGNR